ncbi:MAG TPA: TVP38/TMEM64 family protein [Acidobacteriota bacterium]
MTPKRRIGLGILALVLIAAGALAWNHRELLHSISPSNLRSFLLQWGFWKGAVIFALIYTFSIRPFVPIPPTLYTLAGGLTFGPVWGAVLTVFAATANASITFFIGKYLGKEWVEKHLHGRWKEVQERLKGSGFKAVLLVRLSPVGPPYDLVSYTAGILGIRFRAYFAGTLLGIIPVTAVYSYFGGSFSKGAFGILAAVFGLALISIALPRIWKRIKR